MPFIVKYRIHDIGHAAPNFTTRDKALAMAEYNAQRRRKGELSVQLLYDVVCEGASKQEQYVYLVYQVLRAIRQYYDNRGKVTPEQQNSLLHMSLRLEKDLDDWNTRTRFYLNQHPNCKPDDAEAFAFFQVVEQWREDWHKYFAYKKRRDADKSEVRRLRDICLTLESEIKKYVNKVIGI